MLALGCCAGYYRNFPEFRSQCMRDLAIGDLGMCPNDGAPSNGREWNDDSLQIYIRKFDALPTVDRELRARPFLCRR